MQTTTERNRFSETQGAPRSLRVTAALALLACGAARAQVVARGPVPTSPTQAVLSYTAPDDNVCTVAVREAGSAALVHDVDPALFPNAHLDNRPGAVSLGRSRVVVVGKRTAEQATGTAKRYSRALQAGTDHTFTVDCGGANVLAGSFRTANIKLGGAYMEPIPADPLKPGETAWPALSWLDRGEKIVDPQTGALIRRTSLPGDGAVTSPRLFASARGGANWLNPQAALANDNDAAKHSAVSQDALYLEAAIATNFGGSHNFQTGRLVNLRLEVNGWCEGAGCATAPAEDRTLDFCLTVDGLTCSTNAVSAPLAACGAPPCTGSGHSLQIGDSLNNQEYLPAWIQDGYASPPFDYTSVYQRNGTVNRNGSQLTWVSGDRFDIQWRPGSRIEVNSQPYTIASIESEGSLTLAGAPGGSDSGVSYKASNFGVLVWKRTANGQTLAVQSVSATIQVTGSAVFWDASGGIEGYTNCSNGLTAGPGGEMGWHCHISDVMYWIGKDSGTVSPLGNMQIPYRAGQDGWNAFYCGSSGFLDKQDPNLLYCAWFNPVLEDTIIVKAAYQGNNSFQPLPDAYTPLHECGTPPCWTFTNMTKPSENKAIKEQVAALHPDFASFPNTGFQLIHPVGNSNRFALRAFRDYINNDNQAFYAYFDATTGGVTAAGPSWKYWPFRWSPTHGFLDVGDNSTVFGAPTYWRGALTGSDPIAGSGPYYSRITSGAVGTAGEACPARPSNSPIPANEWPSGDVCLTITVDGEPGDPTPAQYTAGTITTSGNTVTGSGVDWPKLANGFKMKIDGSYYTFTRLTSSTGTLSPAPPAVSGSAYVLYREEVDNPKTGPARRDFAYLQDVEVRDLFCASNTLTPAPFSSPGCSFFFATEYFRLIVKNGNTWTLERGYSKKGTREVFLPLNANAYISTVPTSCELTTYPCAFPSVYWNIDTDPLGQGSGMYTLGPGANGAGHMILRPGAEISAVALEGCPLIDGQGYSCYNVRKGADLRETLSTSTNLLVGGQPAFAGKLGIGVPNAVDSHPSLPGPLTQTSLKWFLDGRPFNGGAGIATGQGQAAANVSGDLYKYPAAQVTRFNRKLLPTLAACGNSPLVDVSGPASLLTGNAADAYKYCVAEQNGECSSGSVKGDVFYNCPKISTHYCRYPGPGVQDSDLRDVCLGDHAAYTSSLIQLGYDKQNMTGAYGRPISKGLSRYRWTDIFWNVKTTPDSQWMINRVTWANGYGHEIVLIKLPPFGPLDNVNRADFVPVDIQVPAPSNAAETHAIVEFGYNPELQCTSRAETCVKGAAALYAFAHENVAGVACAGGCRIQAPAVPQRVLYYRVVRRNSLGQRLSEGPLMVTVSE